MNRIDEAMRKNLVERRDPEDIDDADDLPASVEDALPNGAEEMFYDALTSAKADNPDAEEGAWYAMAWDVVNDEYKKKDGEWVERDNESTQEESVMSKADELIAEFG